MKKLGKLLIVLIVSVMVIAIYPIQIMGFTFSYTSNDWSTEVLKLAVENGLFKGINVELDPKENLTRAQMATIINNAFGAIEKDDISKFTDVSTSAWYYNEMAKAVKMKTFQGYCNNLHPNDYISREEVFVVIARAFSLSGADKEVLDSFLDTSQISYWAIDETASLVSMGYVNSSSGKLNPNSTITIEEFAEFMHNIIKNYIQEEGIYTDIKEGNLMINTPNVTLKDITIKGDLIIGDGVNNGNITLDNVKVIGRILVRGKDANSIIIKGDSSANDILVTKIDGDISTYEMEEAKSDLELTYMYPNKNSNNTYLKFGYMSFVFNENMFELQNKEGVVLKDENDKIIEIEKIKPGDYAKYNLLIISETELKLNTTYSIYVPKNKLISTSGNKYDQEILYTFKTASNVVDGELITDDDCESLKVYIKQNDKIKYTTQIESNNKFYFTNVVQGIYTLIITDASGNIIIEKPINILPDCVNNITIEY